MIRREVPSRRKHRSDFRDLVACAPQRAAQPADPELRPRRQDLCVSISPRDRERILAPLIRDLQLTGIAGKAGASRQHLTARVKGAGTLSA